MAGVAKDEHGRDRLAPFGIRSTNDDAFANVGMRRDDPFDFRWEDVEAPRNDHVPLAIDDVEIVVVIEISDIPRVMPSVALNKGGLLRMVYITDKFQPALDDDLTALTSGKKFSIVDGLNETVKTLAVAGIRQRNPQATPQQIHRMLASLMLGEELARKVYDRAG